MLPPRYQFKDYEDSLYKRMLPYFKPLNDPLREKYTIIMPPPNVTGVLHLGHALDYTIQDVLIRYQRMLGKDVLWQPGTDHAGIYTQLVVERELGQDHRTVGRKAFLEKCWEWKEYSQKRITEQQKRLGISPDWDRSRFTLDEGSSKAVKRVFKTLFDEGLIYREKRLVNWDYKLNTALSDLEVVSRDVQDAMYYVRYNIVDSTEHVIVGTTRPETILGDTALAVHPDDPRYQGYIGKKARTPLDDREIPIISDDYVQMDLGTGVLKVTPAHDFKDYEIGKRHQLQSIDLLDEKGRFKEHFTGLTSEEARPKAIEELGEHLEKIDPIMHSVPFSERTGVRIEPKLTDQWYINAEVLAKPTIEALHRGEFRFIPENWVKTYLNWMENIQPWCISRQLWWGHQIPVWYGPDQHPFCAESEEDAYLQAQSHYGKDVELRQDEDVLDTWFSSALWPFSTLGWPDNLESYFPTCVLVTGFDIIFFWVARMLMMSYHFLKKAPFKDIYIHALVRDEKGQKMSKSKGNIIDPIELIDQYGTDSLRLALTALAVPGRDIPIGKKVVEGYSHFITKLWNAGRFLLMQEESTSETHAISHWFKREFNRHLTLLGQHYEEYRLDLIVQELYELIWDKFCDVYLEGLKVAKDFQTGHKLYQDLLKLCHPVMPFVTQALSDGFSKEELIIAPWPKPYDYDEAKALQCQEIIDIAGFLRQIKGLLDLKGRISVLYQGSILDTALLSQLAQLKELHEGEDAALMPFSYKGTKFYIIGCSRNEAIPVLEKKLAQFQGDLEKSEKLLNNPRFKEEKPDLYAEKKKAYDQIITEMRHIKDLMA